MRLEAVSYSALHESARKTGDVLCVTDHDMIENGIRALDKRCIL